MHYRYQVGGIVYDVAIERVTGAGFSVYRATVNGEEYRYEILDIQPGELSLSFEGRPVTLYWAADGNKKWVSREGCTYLVEPPAIKRIGQASDGSAEGTIRSPIPAQVRSIEGSEGEVVAKGDTMILLEAMKMEIRIRAPGSGKIRKIYVQVGQAVERDQILAEVEL